MDAKFWLQRWESNQIAFHQASANPLLVAHFDQLDLPKGQRVFVPLCGKTLDIAWLLAQGYQVVGAELSEIAIQQLFVELDVVPQITVVGNLKHYHVDDLDVFVGDIFDITPELMASVGDVDAIFDRAALVALPEMMRSDYAAHVIALTLRAPQLLLTYEYDQSVVQGPPFSVSEAEVMRHYATDYIVKCLARRPVEGGMRRATAANEVVWVLMRA